MEKRCARCEKMFVCTGDVNCWCSTTFVAPKVSNYISDLYDDCICEDCIKELTKKMISDS
ncbi:MAG: Cysteine-rich [Bacteroidetes bacterium]|nr:Cysteine-rich [Bacteroidota bacterium]